MNRNPQSRSAASHFLLASLIASAAFAAHAQTENPTNQPPPQRATAPMSQADQGVARTDRAASRVERMQARIAQRLAALKVRLGLAPQQEGAWETFAVAMQPTPDALSRRAAMRADRNDTLTTPERIDRMRARRSERDAAMDQRFDATKAFYAQLSAEQQKTFDENAQREHRMGRHGRHHGKSGDMQAHGPHHGGGHHEVNSQGVERQGS